jgi:hypothetical protein
MWYAICDGTRKPLRWTLHFLSNRDMLFLFNYLNARCKSYSKEKTFRVIRFGILPVSKISWVLLYVYFYIGLKYVVLSYWMYCTYTLPSSFHSIQSIVIYEQQSHFLVDSAHHDPNPLTHSIILYLLIYNTKTLNTHENILHATFFLPTGIQIVKIRNLSYHFWPSFFVLVSNIAISKFLVNSGFFQFPAFCINTILYNLSRFISQLISS